MSSKHKRKITAKTRIIIPGKKEIHRTAKIKNFFDKHTMNTFWYTKRHIQ